MENSMSISVDMMDVEYLNPYDDLNKSLVIWNGMLDVCSHSFFQSTSWIKCWLESLEGKQQVTMITGYYNDKIVLSFFVCIYDQYRNYFIHSKTANINSTGNTYYDVLYQEYNKVLTAKNVEITLDDIHNLICKYNCDELKFERISNKFDLLTDCRAAAYKLKPVKKFKTYYINLDAVRDSKKDYITLLSSNRRQQIRRSVKHYSKNKEILIAQAETLSEALEMLKDLMCIHQKEWVSRGEPGAFSNKYFDYFHITLVKEAFNKGQIQILKIYTLDETIGYLYNFVYNNEVLFYQCGFNYSSDNKKRPGLVSHYKAIQLNLDNGLSKYDFLSGDIQYKKSLSTDFHYMTTVKIQKNHLKFKIEDGLKNLRNSIKSMHLKLQVKR